MGFFLEDANRDLMLDDIADNGDTLHICVGEPADYADVTNHSKGSVSLTVGDGNGDYVIADGDISGRKLSLTQQSVTPSADALIDHLVIVDTTNSLIKAINTAKFNVKNAVARTIYGYVIAEVRDPQG